MSKTKVYQVIGIDGATLMVFYTQTDYWQFRLISFGGEVFVGERKIYYSAEAALKAGLECLTWGS